MERIAFALEPARRPVAHEHQQVFPPTSAWTIQAFVKMFVARVKMMRLGRQAFGEIMAGLL